MSYSRLENAVLESRSLNVVESKFLLEKFLNKDFNFYKITYVVRKDKIGKLYKW